MQKLRYSKYIKVFSVGADFCILLVLYFLFSSERGAGTEFLSEKNILLCLALCGLWLLLSGQTKLYSLPRTLTFTRYLQILFTHTALFTAGIYLITKLSAQQFPLASPFRFAMILSGGIGVVKACTFIFLQYIRKRGYNHRNILILGEDSAAENLSKLLQVRKGYGINIKQHSNENCSLEELRNLWETFGIYAVYIPEHLLYSRADIQNLFRMGEVENVQINLIPSLSENPYFEHELAYYDSQPVLVKRKFPLDYLSNRILKRSADLLLVLIFFLLIGWWLYPAIALYIYLSDGGPVFFSQKRYGKSYRIFQCYKFRTMRKDTASDSKTTSRTDHRITPAGRFLRKTSLDELPQLYNVLKGEMSLVGPRPHMIAVDEKYRKEISRYDMRLRVKPGLTGLAQVSGFRGDGENMQARMTGRILADRYYVNNWTPLLDFIILGKTILLLLRGDKDAF